MLLFSMCSFFFLNALFFTEEYISERYNSGETLNIFYILKNEISNAIDAAGSAGMASLAFDPFISSEMMKKAASWETTEAKVSMLQ